MNTGFALLRTIACGAACLLGFAGASAVIGLLTPFPEVPGVSAKLAHLAERGGDYEVICVGSSRVRSQFAPAVFDGVADARSFNAGIAAMVAPESLFFIRRILALHPPRLKWLLIELTDLVPVIDPMNVRSARVVYWHDLHHTSLALSDLWTSARPLPLKLTESTLHLRYFAERFTQIGRGPALLEPRLIPPSKKIPRVAELDEGGFHPPEDPHPTAAQLTRMAQVHAELRSREWPAVPLRPGYQRELQAVIREVRGAGIEPVFFVAPSFDWRSRLAPPAEDVRCITFYDESRYAGLFDPANFADTVHLNRTGAELFTRALAEQFAALR